MTFIKEVTSHPNSIPAANNIQKKNGVSFSETLTSLMSEVNNKLMDADQKSAEFAVGKNHNIHEVMIASEKANLSFRFLLTIRNKLLEAYQEIMRMQF